MNFKYVDNKEIHKIISSSFQRIDGKRLLSLYETLPCTYVDKDLAELILNSGDPWDTYEEIFVKATPMLNGTKVENYKIYAVQFVDSFLIKPKVTKPYFILYKI